MVQMVKFVLIVASLIVAAVGATMTFAFGMLFIAGQERLLYAVLFAVSDVVKFALPTVASYQRDSGRSWRAAQTMLIYAFLVLVSSSFHVGLVLKAKDNDAGDSKGAHARYESAVREREELTRQIAALGNPRGSGQIKADIAIAERDPVFTDEKRSNRCTNDTAPESRKLCDRWRALKGEEDSAGEASRLRRQLDGVNVRLSGMDVSTALKRADAASEQIGEALGLKPETTLLIIGLLIAIVIEVCSSLLLDTAVNMRPQPKVAKQEEKPAEVEAPPAEPLSEIAEEPKLDVVDVPHSEPEAKREALDPVAWISTNLRKRPGADLPQSSIYERYTLDAEKQGMRTASESLFVRRLGDAGFDKARQTVNKQKVTIIKGAAIAPARLALVG